MKILLYPNRRCCLGSCQKLWFSRRQLWVGAVFAHGSNFLSSSRAWQFINEDLTPWRCVSAWACPYQLSCDICLYCL